jgi:predicted HicB family RNase H-like nuclease
MEKKDNKNEEALNIKIDGSMKRSIKAMAAKQGRSLRKLVEEALSTYMTKQAEEK